jgi:hypothetical protein
VGHVADTRETLEASGRELIGGHLRDDAGVPTGVLEGSDGAIEVRVGGVSCPDRRS